MSRAGKDWALKMVDNWTDPEGQQASLYLHRGLVVAVWNEQARRGVLHMSQVTVHELRAADGDWWGQVETMKVEAMTVKTVVRDVSVAAAMSGKAVVQPGHAVPTADVGITALTRDVVALVREMTKYEHPTSEVQAEFARRYGRYRDAVATLRVQFDECEGAFEVAQAMLTTFITQDD